MVDPDDLPAALGRVVRKREPDDATAPARVNAGSYERLVDAVVAEVTLGPVERVTAGTTAAAREPSDGPSPTIASHEVRTAATLSRPNPTATRRAPTRNSWLGLPALAVAAGLCFVLGRNLLGGGPDVVAELAPYTAELKGSVASVRSASTPAAETIKLAPGTELTILLRPENPVEGEVNVQVALSPGVASGAWTVVESRAAVATSGSLRVTATAPAELPLQGNICAVVARAERHRAGLAAASDRGTGWQRFCWPFVHVDSNLAP